MAKDYAFDEAVKLASANLAGCEEWVEAEDVIDFIREMHEFLCCPEGSGKKEADKKEKSKKGEKGEKGEKAKKQQEPKKNNDEQAQDEREKKDD